MNEWIYWVYFKTAISILALIICLFSAAIVWRMRGILQWQGSLKSEMETLEKKISTTTGPRHLAILEILHQCGRIRRSRAPYSDSILRLDEYLRRIAACYHPDCSHPELRITLGQVLAAATAMVARLDEMTRRKGLRRFAWIRIRHIRKAFERYNLINQNLIVRWFLKHQRIIARAMHVQRFLLFDPFSWLLYFSNRMTILIVMRTLLLDIYLYIGNLAVEAYDPEHKFNANTIDNEQLIETLATLYDAEPFEGWQSDPEVIEIRSQLVGLPKRIVLPPTIDEWRQSTLKAVEIIARRHFSHSEAPLEEAALGPIILKLQSFLRSIGEVSHYAGIRQLLGVRLESLYSAQTFAANFSNGRLTSLIQKAWGGYRTVRWPLKIFRWIKRSSPTGVAMDLGWETFRKGLINFLARFTFDRVCREADELYRISLKNSEIETDKSPG